MTAKTTPRVVIIGGGIIGASIAFQTAARGAQVWLVDANQPGQSTTKVSFAWINSREKNPREYHDLNRRSLDMWERFARRLGGDLGLTWGGELRWTATPEGASTLTARVKTMQTWGYPIHLLTPTGLKEMEPNLAPGAVTAASYSPADGHVDTAKVVQACVRETEKMGGVILANTTVTGIELAEESGNPKAARVQTSKGEIPCDTLVIAGGPDTPALAALAGLAVPVYYTFGATILTEPTQPLFENAAVVHTPPDLVPQIAFRQLADGTVMIHGGNASTAEGSMGKTEAEVDQVYQAAVGYVPALKEAVIKEVRTGRRPIPQDGRPIIGYTQAVPNLYLAVMHSGVTLSALVGEMAASEIVDQIQVDILAPYRLERFL